MVDIYLFPEATSPYDIILSFGLRGEPIVLIGMSSGTGYAYAHLTIPVGRRTKAVYIPIPSEEPPVGVSLYDDLVERYGKAEGKRVWGGMLLERKGPFAEGAKYDPDQPEVRKRLVAAGLDPK
jgi:hypothetical protein